MEAIDNLRYKRVTKNIDKIPKNTAAAVEKL
jgi:hypothetical protein